MQGWYPLGGRGHTAELLGDSTIGIKNSFGKVGTIMKVLAINGSARKDGNTAILIGTVFEELNKAGIETEMIQLANNTIEPCKAC